MIISIFSRGNDRIAVEGDESTMHLHQVSYTLAAPATVEIKNANTGFVWIKSLAAGAGTEAVPMEFPIVLNMDGVHQVVPGISVAFS
jgi:ethanolamine utilization microcompartment shell protein EutL